MRKFKLNIYIFLILLVIFSIGLFIYQIRITNSLKRELSGKESKLEEITTVKEVIYGIEKKLVESELKEQEMLTKIPEGKESIFDLMRELTMLGDEIGLRDINFRMEEKPEGNDKQEGEGKPRKGFDLLDKKPASSSTLIDKVDYHYIKMSFKCGYRELFAFIKKIINLERLVSIDVVEIKREENTVPRQSITLDLVTYTFPFSH